MLYSKGFIIQEIHREAVEAAAAVPHENDDCVKIPAHTDENKAVLPLGPETRYSETVAPWQAGSKLHSALKQLQKVNLHPFTSHKNMGIKSLSGGEWNRRKGGRAQSERMT